MFTGIIEDVGRVHEWQLKRGSGVLTLKSHLPSNAIGLGSSVAVNGTCLTVVAKAKGRFTVEVSLRQRSPHVGAYLVNGVKISLDVEKRHWLAMSHDHLALSRRDIVDGSYLDKFSFHASLHFSFQSSGPCTS